MANHYTRTEDGILTHMVREGYTSIEIARDLGRSPDSVQRHVKELRRKTGDASLVFSREKPLEREKDRWPVTGHEVIPWHIVISGRNQFIPSMKEDYQ